MLDSFAKDHRHLAELADRIEACRDDAGPIVAMQLGQLRCAFAHEAVRHTIVEDRLVYRALEKADPQWMARHRETFPSLRTDMFLHRLQQHIHRWEARVEEGDRPRRAAATRELLQLLRTRMEMEEHVLYPRFRELQATGPRSRRFRQAPSAGAEVRRIVPAIEPPPA